MLILGNKDSATYDPGSLRAVSNRLSLAMSGRGRVWSGGTVTAEGDKRIFQYATARPEDANKTNLLNVLLYAFADVSINGNPEPQSYIGSVLVTEETLENVKLEGLFISNGQEWATPSSSWTLFEKMPLDRHDTFKMGIVAYVDANPDTATEAFKGLAESIRHYELQLESFRTVMKAQYPPANWNLWRARAPFENGN